MPPEPDKATPDPGDSSIFRRFLQRQPLYLSSSVALREFSRPSGEKLLERLKEMDIATNCIRIDGIISPPSLTVVDAKKFCRASQMEIIKSKLRNCVILFISSTNSPAISSSYEVCYPNQPLDTTSRVLLK
ncbi:hypothetical protein LXL04_020751 [Taraxacum kok-saghyz]